MHQAIQADEINSHTATVTAQFSAGSSDYAVISDETITFPIGVTEFLFPVNTLMDSEDEGEESFRAILSAPVTGGAILGNATTATVFISDRKIQNKTGCNV